MSLPRIQATDARDQLEPAGAGISYWHLNIDYAYQKHECGNAHRVEFGVFL